jgi:hypothetical protein
MSYFSFNRDSEGNVQVTDSEALEALELLLNNVALLNVRFEEAFRTNINLEDIDREN